MADAPTPMGDLFATYNPQGGGPDALFAPAYIAGYAPSEQAVNDWTAKHRTDYGVIDESRMPSLWNAPDVTQTAPGVWAPAQYGGAGMGRGPYGEGSIPQNLSFGLDKGIADINALRAVAMGTEYKTSQARKDAIAERLLFNEASKDAYQMRANARGEPGLTGGADPKPGGYGSGDTYTKYMGQYNPSGFNQPLLINNNAGGSGYIKGPTDQWPANIPGNPNAGGGMPPGLQGSASNLNLIRPWNVDMLNADNGGAGGSAGGED